MKEKSHNEKQLFTLRPGDLWGRVYANAADAMSSLDKTKTWDIEIRPHVKVRSESQRKSLFGLAYKILMGFIGLRGAEDKQYLHNYFCIKYFGPHPKLPNKPLRTTTKNELGEREEINTKVAIEFYALIQQMAAELGVVIPDPDPMSRFDSHA